MRQSPKSADCFIPLASARARFCAFARHAFFAAAIAALTLTLPFASADPALAEEQAPAVLSLEFNQADGILEIEWSGLIAAGFLIDRDWRIRSPLSRDFLMASGVFALINVALVFLGPMVLGMMISWQAHLGGYLAGMAMMLILCRNIRAGRSA